ncbi:MAG: right-handed parallel beta-helix repeat-containing protein [Bacteroidota bacterium]
MKIFNIYIILIIFFPYFIKGQTILSGTFSSDTIIQASLSPYLVNANIYINPGVEFFVESGTVIFFNTNMSIGVNGRLVLDGTASDSIKLYPSDGTTMWGKISGSSAEIVMRYTHIKKASQIVYANYGALNISNCRFDSITGGDGIAAHYVDSVIIENNIINGIKNTGKIDAIDCDGIAYGFISNNRITNWYDDAIDIGTSASNIIISYNYFENCNFAISIGEASQATAYRNVIVKNYGGLQSHTSAVLTAYNNTLYNNGVGIECFHGTAVGTGGIANIRNTIFSKCSSGNYQLQPSSNLTVSYSCYDTDSLIGFNNVYGDPLFTDTLLRDFYLLQGSVCIDSGDPADPLDTNGNYIDIGAFEFYSPTKVIEQQLNDINVFPNPFQNFIKIDLTSEHNDIVRYYLYSILGELIDAGNIYDRNLLIHTETLEKGMYILKIVYINNNSKEFLISKILQ